MATVDPVAQRSGRDIVTVTGRVVSIEVQPRNAQPTLTARISDGTGFVDAIFQGRRGIPGVSAGARITVAGRLSTTEATPQLFNPRFELG